ncbi:MAG: plasmid pRiA4b ORF-3 family protein [Acidobacteria bacterium]|nr:plasmid pRiA4b ORF-3 family protein [Acidobacteriota bacterium]
MPRYYDFEVTLCDVEPRIFRRFLLRDDLTFAAVHEAIQDACGWTNSHLHVFRRLKAHERGIDLAGLPHEDMDEPPPDSGRVKLQSFFGSEPSRCFYLYDFGDSWWHELVCHGTVELPESFQRRLLGGARAFPPDDCGGTGGYQDCVRVILGDDEDLEEAEELREWLQGWRPEVFYFEEAKREFDR